jgi:hypothetical protein
LASSDIISACLTPVLAAKQELFHSMGMDMGMSRSKTAVRSRYGDAVMALSGGES